MSRILITGGTGFIGSHLARRLALYGHKVHIVDRENNNQDLWFRQHITGYTEDCRRDTWKKVRPDSCKDGWDFVYHLAATVGVNRVLKNPKECIENNIDSLRSVLALGIPGIFTSTSEVYGKNDDVLREDSPLVYSSLPRWSYAASKLIGEWLALQAGWKVVRLFNVVGPGQSSHYGAVLPRFIEQVINNEPLTIFGHGSQIRTFIDVNDCIEILDKLRDKSFDVLNVGGKIITSIRDLAYSVNTIIGKEPYAIKQVPYNQAYADGFDECQSRIPDLTKLDTILPSRQYTGFVTTITNIKESLQKKSLAVSAS